MNVLPDTLFRPLRRVPATAWFIALFGLFCCAYEYGRVLHQRPFPHHIMRQADCLGMTWNYAFTDPDLFDPRMMNLHGDDNTTGRTAGEFPLLYWVVGMLWRLFGQSEFIYRAIGLALHFAGSLALYRIAREALRSPFWGAWVALLFFTSPTIIYFAISFLPDVPALDLVLIGWACFATYLQHRRRRSLFLAIGLMSLGTLLKVTAGMSLLALLGVLFLESVLPGVSTRRWRVFEHRALAWIAAVLAALVVGAWYAYAAWFNREHGNPFTPNSIWPAWRVDANGIAEILGSARHLLLYELFAIPIWVLLVMALLLVIWNQRRIPWQLAVFNTLLVLGLLLFLVLWFQALDNHDYYFIAPMVVLMTLLLTALWWLFRERPPLLKAMWLKGVAALVLVYSLAYGVSGLRMRVHGDSPIGGESFAWLHPAPEIAHWDEDRYWQLAGVLDIESFSRALGITREAKVLVAPDMTWQTGLYLMGQRGWNDYTVHLADSTQIDHYIRYHGADYLYVLHRDFGERPYVHHFLSHPLGEHGGIWIYDLRPLR